MVAALLAGTPAGARAQIGGSTDIITGIVSAPDGTPIEGARVEITSIESQVVRTRLTDAKGQFTILFPNGGGVYQMVVRYIGMAPYQAVLQREPDDDRIVTRVRLEPTPTVLERVVTRGQQRAPPQTGVRPEPGNVERVFTPEQLARLPIDASDLAAIAALAPGVVAIPGTDSTAAAFSVAGQPPTQNVVTLDGAQFSGASVPNEAVRVTRVVTNSYDVARGQFTGGQVATTTRSGTNRVQGTFTYGMRDPSLQWENEADAAIGAGYTEHVLSGGIGGPLQRNRVFAFGSFQLRRRDDPLLSLTRNSVRRLDQLGVHPDSVARFLDIVGQDGLSPNMGGTPDERRNDQVTLLGRADWTITDAHSATLRGDLRIGENQGNRIGSLALGHSGGEVESNGAGLQLTARSQFGATIINEARAYRSVDRRTAEPYVRLPQGRVRVASPLPDGTRSVSVLEFGGHASLPQRTQEGTLEVSDELSWVQPGGGHRFKFGGLLQRADFDEMTAANRSGTFTYNSLADLDTGRAASFSRTLVARAREGGVLTAAAYAGDIWRVRPGIQADYGVRVEGTDVFGEPDYNPAVHEAFGRRTDRLPRDVAVSPRIGFNWTVRGAQGQPPRFTLRGGFGDFRGRLPTSLFATALDATGLSEAQTQLLCVGDAVPDADWSQFLRDPGSVPSECAPGAPPTLVSGKKPVTVFEPGFAVPRAVRASIGIQKRVRDRFMLGLDAVFSAGRSQYGVVDLNLVDTARFRIAQEGGRPVFTLPGSIVQRSGAVSLAGSRRDTSFAQVFAFHSGNASRSTQAILSFGGLTTLGMTFNATYTWTFARDQSSFTCCAAAQGYSSVTTAGDPRIAEWGRSDFERRHSIVTTATYPVTAWLEVTAIGRLVSGAPFTPMVGGDPNGDGSRNDRAFIFDPDVTDDPVMAAAMRRLLATAPEYARSCLSEQLGRIAGRNSCTGPWTSALDLQFNFRPNSWGLERRLTFSLITVNLLPGIDRLLYGEKYARGWGQARRVDQTLMYVRGFDRLEREFRYEVNGRFGDERASRIAQSTPFMIGFQGRFSVGPDPARERIRQLFGQGGARAGRGVLGGPRRPRGGVSGLANAAERGRDVAERFSRMVPNPILRILSMRDSLKLTAAQDSSLLRISERLATRIDTIAVQVAAAIERAGPNPDLPTLAAVSGPRLLEARSAVADALRAAQGVLTPEQWRLLPAPIRNPAAAAERAVPRP